MRLYLTDKKSLGYFEGKATSDFWDKHWEASELEERIRSCKDDGCFVPSVKKYLPKGSIILEGGCGQSHILYALQYNGYKAIGIDFAKNTVGAIKNAVPELDIMVGDVRNLPITQLDGYISGGVIEHFWVGYEPILSEMARTVKTGGYLFITFPHMSLLRKLKKSIGLYPVTVTEQLKKERNNFYQFALESGEVICSLEKLGFSLIEKKNEGGLKGFKDEVSLFRPILQKIYDGKILRGLRSYLNRILTPFASHMCYLILKRN